MSSGACVMSEKGGKSRTSGEVGVRAVAGGGAGGGRLGPSHGGKRWGGRGGGGAEGEWVEEGLAPAVVVSGRIDVSIEDLPKVPSLRPKGKLREWAQLHDWVSSITQLT